MVYFITGGSGTGKTSELIKRIRIASELNKEIVAIVPEQFSYEFDRNLYRNIGAVSFNRLLSFSFRSIARHIFQLYGDARRIGSYANDLQKIVIMREAIDNVAKSPNGLQYFNRQYKKKGFTDSMLKLLADIRQSGMNTEKFSEKTQFLEGRIRKKTDDISGIFYEYERLLKSYKLKDNFDDTKESAKTANRHNFFKNKTVFIDEFENFSGVQLDEIKLMIAQCDDVYITLRTENVNAPKFTLFDAVNKTYHHITLLCKELNLQYEHIALTYKHKFKSEDLLKLSDSILRNNTVKPTIDSESIAVYEARDFYSECDYVCATIKRLIYHNKELRYNDIAILSSSIEEYLPILESTFERYDIPGFFSIEKSVKHTSLMIAVSSLFDIALRKTYKSELLFNFLKTGLLDISLFDISALENYCYKWSIDGEKWCNPFKSDKPDAKRAEKIRKAIITPLEKLRIKCKNATVGEICSAIYSYLTESGIEKNVAISIHSFIKNNQEYNASEQKRIWASLIDILDDLSEILYDKKLPSTELCNLFSSLTERVRHSTPPQTLDSVSVALAQTARLNSPKIVFIMGVNEGKFPGTVKPSGIFSETDKQLLSERGIETSRPTADLIADERLTVYRTVSSASERLYLSYSLSNLSGEVQYPSLILNTVYSLFANGNRLKINESELSPSYFSVTKKAMFYQYMQNCRTYSSQMKSIEYILLNDDFYAEKLKHIFTRSSATGEHAVTTPKLMENLLNFAPLELSSTKFEQYSKCPFKFFCQYCLRLKQQGRYELNSLLKGDIIHHCLQRLLSDKSKSEFLAMSPEDISNSVKAYANAYKSKESTDDFECTPRFDFNYEKISQELVRVAMHLKQELTVSDFMPAAFELDLNQNSLCKPFTLQLNENRYIKFNGIVDRVDMCEINSYDYIRIVDYKSSARQPSPVLLNSGIDMQGLIYLLALTDKNSGLNAIPAGILYSPVIIKVPDLDKKREVSENISHIKNNLKMSGILLKNSDVLNAMEHDLTGNFIPAKLNKAKEIAAKCCVEDFEKLRGFTYKKLKDMGENLYNGCISASPLVYKGENSVCQYCDYINICGNQVSANARIAEEADLTEIQAIFGEGDAE